MLLVLFVLATCLMVACVVGFGRLLFASSPNLLVHCFTRFIVGLLIVVISSISFWDILPVFFTHNQWMSFAAKVGKENVNGVRSIFLIYSGAYGLAALHLMVPEGDRRDWPWWKAWAYPPMGLATGLRRALRWRWKGN